MTRPHRLPHTAVAPLLAGWTLVAGGLAVALHPALAARWASGDGELGVVARTWLPRYQGAALVVALVSGLLLVQALRGRRQPARHRFLAGAVLRGHLILAGILLAGGITELALRLLPQRSEPGESYREYTRRYMRAVRPQLNADGYRDRPFTARDPAEYRVLVVGDSFVFGYGLPEPSQAFAQQLEAAAAQSRRRPVVRCLNAGRPGTDTRDHRRALEDLLPRLQPDLVVLGYHLNDIETREQYLAFIRSQDLVPVLSPVLERVSIAWRLLEAGAHQLLVRSGLRDDYLGHLRRLFGAEHPAFRHQRQELVRLIDLVRSRDTRLAVVVFPLIEHLDQDPLAAEHARLAALFAAHEVPTLDLRALFEGEDERDLWVSALDHHLNAAALARAAHASARFLDSRVLLPPPPAAEAR